VSATTGSSRSALRALVPRGVRLSVSRFLARRSATRLEGELAAIAAGSTPIIAGPWLGEVGFELLYWVPFLAWFADRYRVAPERLMVLSRGGTRSWYEPFAGRYADVFDQVSPEEFRAAHDRRVRDLGEQKQTQLTEFERLVVANAASGAGIASWSLVHPSRMYDLFMPFWWGHLQTPWVHERAQYRRMAPPAAGLGCTVPGLPDSYVAVKFYFNECFPANEANRAFVRETLRQLTGQGEVVALSTGLNIDDHGGCRVDEFGVRHLPEGIPPARNLCVQTAVVAGARAFVGTYGGFSYLAPFHGVPSFACYSDASGFSPRHLAMAREAFDRIGMTGSLRARDSAGGVPALLEGMPLRG
jgi:hypothetical protein